ncbi:MAG TPA: AAA family ATPase [Trebonia sp.]|jgi:predicted kinase|nr:AAA family ATPase [Trebonia sp.]
MPVVAVLVGLQASGKTTFGRDVLGTGYVQVSKDHFPNAKHRQRRQMRLVRAALQEGRDVVVDNTNPSREEWQPLIEAARDAGARDNHGCRKSGSGRRWRPPSASGSRSR